MTLKDNILKDNRKVFLKNSEFGDNLLIIFDKMGKTYKVELCGSLQSAMIQNNSGSEAALMRASHTLYIEYPLTHILSVDGEQITVNAIFAAGSKVSINNIIYTVVDISDEMGIATINITRAKGRVL